MKKIILIVLSVIIISVGGYLAYVKFGKGGSSSPASLTSVLTGNKLNPNCEYNDPDLCKFMNSWKEVKYYTVNSTITDKDGKTSQNTLKSIGEDKFQMVSSESGKEAYNVITIGNTTYTKDYTDNKWFKQTVEPAKNSEIKTEESKYDFEDSTAQKITYQKIGTEACGKYTCFKYKEVDPDITDSTNFIYFDTNDYQLRKTRTEVTDGSVMESTMDYSKISIDAPSPTKEGSPYGLTTTPTTSLDTTTTIPSATAPAASDITIDSSLDIPTDSSLDNTDATTNTTDITGNE